MGHSDIVTCVAVSITNKTQVVSGSWDCNLIVWDINTGSDLHLLSGHLGKVTCVKVTGDGSIAVSSEFNFILFHPLSQQNILSENTIPINVIPTCSFYFVGTI